MSNRAWFWFMLASAALNAWIATRGLTPGWFNSGLCLGLSVPYLGWWMRDRDEARQDARRDDEAPRTVATWPCPDCGQDIPVTLHTQHIVIARPDTTDIHAHQLTHDREGA